MPAGAALVDLVDDELPDLGTQLIELVVVEIPQISGTRDVLENHVASLLHHGSGQAQPRSPQGEGDFTCFGAVNSPPDVSSGFFGQNVIAKVEAVAADPWPDGFGVRHSTALRGPFPAEGTTPSAVRFGQQRTGLGHAIVTDVDRGPGDQFGHGVLVPIAERTHGHRVGHAPPAAAGDPAGRVDDLVDPLPADPDGPGDLAERAAGRM